MIRVKVGGLYEEFNTIEEVISYLKYDDTYKELAEVMQELLTEHDDAFEADLSIKYDKQIENLESDISACESKIYEARQEIERVRDLLDYEEDDVVNISDVRTYLTRIDIELS